MSLKILRSFFSPYLFESSYFKKERERAPLLSLSVEFLRTLQSSYWITYSALFIDWFFTGPFALDSNLFASLLSVEPCSLTDFDSFQWKPPRSVGLPLTFSSPSKPQNNTKAYDSNGTEWHKNRIWSFTEVSFLMSHSTWTFWLVLVDCPELLEEQGEKNIDLLLQGTSLYEEQACIVKIQGWWHEARLLTIAKPLPRSPLACSVSIFMASTVLVRYVHLLSKADSSPCLKWKEERANSNCMC